MKKIQFFLFCFLSFNLFTIQLVHADVKVITPEIYEQVMDNIDVSDGDLKKYKNIFKAVTNGDFETADNIAAIVDLGGGGFKLGPENPTFQATHFWDAMLSRYRSSERRWITAGLRSAGLPVM